MSVNLCPLTPMQALRDYHYVDEDFTCTRDAAEWAIVQAAAGTITGVVGDAAGGIMTLDTAAATDNHGAVMERPVESFLTAAGKPIVFEASVQFTELDTDKANILVGLVATVAATTIANDGGGIATTCGFYFFKLDGQTLWSVASECNDVVIGSTSLSAANSLDKIARTAGTAAGTFQVLKIEVQPLTSTSAEARYYINGTLVAKHVGDFITSATEMQIAFGLKNGSAHQQTLLIDRVHCIQKR